MALTGTQRSSLFTRGVSGALARSQPVGEALPNDLVAQVGADEFGDARRRVRSRGRSAAGHEASESQKLQVRQQFVVLPRARGVDFSQEGYASCVVRSAIGMGPFFKDLFVDARTGAQQRFDDVILVISKIAS